MTLPVTREPRIEITPSAEDYDQLCRDLAALRAAGASSNTAAVVDAVHRAAKTEYPGSRHERAGKRGKRSPATSPPQQER